MSVSGGNHFRSLGLKGSGEPVLPFLSLLPCPLPPEALWVWTLGPGREGGLIGDCTLVEEQGSICKAGVEEGSFSLLQLFGFWKEEQNKRGEGKGVSQEGGEERKKRKNKAIRR